MSAKKPAAQPAKQKQRYGIAEWYGRLYRNLSDAERKEFAEVKFTEMPCPFMHQVPNLGPKSKRLNCNKNRGVCSLRNFHEPESSEGEVEFGAITTTCPNRFLENGAVVDHIAATVLGTENPRFAKEIPFLKRPQDPVAQAAVEATEEEQGAPEAGLENAGNEDVGRIDLVFIHPDDADNWCAVEMQAVYFSGQGMGGDFAAIKSFGGNGIPKPTGTRRPDFRSSGPKRLMPQLMIKVPTLRRWGKKMVVVIDEPFFRAMASMKSVRDISNCDIVWVIVRFDEQQAVDKAVLTIAETVYTTLEDAVTGLTAGVPTTLAEFESKLAKKAKSLVKDQAPSVLI